MNMTSCPPQNSLMTPSMQDCIWHQYYQQPCPRCGRTHYQQQTTVNGTIYCSSPHVCSPCNKVVPQIAQSPCVVQANQNYSTRQVSDKRTNVRGSMSSIKRNGLQPEYPPRRGSASQALETCAPCGRLLTTSRYDAESVNDYCIKSCEYTNRSEQECEPCGISRPCRPCRPHTPCIPCNNPCRPRTPYKACTPTRDFGLQHSSADCCCNYYAAQTTTAETNTDQEMSSSSNQETMCSQPMSDKDVQIKKSTYEFNPQTTETRMVSASFLSRLVRGRSKNDKKSKKKLCHEEPICPNCVGEDSPRPGTTTESEEREILDQSMRESSSYLRRTGHNKCKCNAIRGNGTEELSCDPNYCRELLPEKEEQADEATYLRNYNLQNINEVSQSKVTNKASRDSGHVSYQDEPEITDKESTQETSQKTKSSDNALFESDRSQVIRPLRETSYKSYPTLEKPSQGASYGGTDTLRRNKPQTYQPSNTSDVTRGPSYGQPGSSSNYSGLIRDQTYEASYSNVSQEQPNKLVHESRFEKTNIPNRDIGRGGTGIFPNPSAVTKSPTIGSHRDWSREPQDHQSTASIYGKTNTSNRDVTLAPPYRQGALSNRSETTKSLRDSNYEPSYALNSNVPQEQSDKQRDMTRRASYGQSITFNTSAEVNNLNPKSEPSQDVPKELTYNSTQMSSRNTLGKQSRETEIEQLERPIQDTTYETTNGVGREPSSTQTYSYRNVVPKPSNDAVEDLDDEGRKLKKKESRITELIRQTTFDKKPSKTVIEWCSKCCTEEKVNPKKKSRWSFFKRKKKE